MILNSFKTPLLPLFRAETGGHLAWAMHWGGRWQWCHFSCQPGERRRREPAAVSAGFSLPLFCRLLSLLTVPPTPYQTWHMELRKFSKAPSLLCISCERLKDTKNNWGGISTTSVYVTVQSIKSQYLRVMSAPLPPTPCQGTAALLCLQNKETQANITELGGWLHNTGGGSSAEDSFLLARIRIKEGGALVNFSLVWKKLIRTIVSLGVSHSRWDSLGSQWMW